MLRGIVALATLIVIVKGAWWATAVQPVVLSLGAILSAVDLDVLNVGLTEMMPFISKKE